MSGNQRHSPVSRMMGLMIAAGAVLMTGGCATQAPSIAHVHVGHAVTAAHDTPDRLGYLVLAEDRAQEAVQAAEQAVAATSLTQMQSEIARVDEITNSREDYPLVKAVREASSHIEFAADSDDSSANIRAASQEFSRSIEGIIYRSDLIRLYAVDAARSSSRPEVESLAQEIERLARANMQGDPTDQPGRQAGVAQLREQIDGAISRENPPYTTVDRWYLFNLIRLPNGDWIFRRDSSGSRGPGY